MRINPVIKKNPVGMLSPMEKKYFFWDISKGMAYGATYGDAHGFQNGYIYGYDVLFHPILRTWRKRPNRTTTASKFSSSLLDMYCTIDKTALFAVGATTIERSTDGSTWTALSGSQPATLGGTSKGTFTELLDNIIYCRPGYSPVQLSGGTWPNLTTKETILTSNLSSGICTTFENRNFIAGSTNPMLLYYSDAGTAVTNILAQHVQVGETPITGIYKMGSQLIIMKKDSIWARMGSYSALSGNQFIPVAGGLNTTVNCGIVANGVLYFSQPDGIYTFDGGRVNCITANNFKTISFAGIQPRYWEAAGLVIFGSYCYDINSGIWSLSDFSGCYVTGLNSLFYGGSDTSLYTWGWDTSLPTTADSSIILPFTDCGNPISDKYLSAIYYIGYGVGKVEAYGRYGLMNSHTTLTLPSTSFDGQGKCVCPPNTRFKEISLALFNTTNTYFSLKSIGIEYVEDPI